MIPDDRQKSINLAPSDKEYLEQTQCTMTIMEKIYHWILKLLPIRVWVVVLLFLCVYSTSMARYNINLAVVSMTIVTAASSSDEVNSTRELCPASLSHYDPWLDIELPTHANVTIETIDQDTLEVHYEEENDTIPKLRDKLYAWSASTQSNIFGAFFWSYFSCNVPAGIIVDRLGGKVCLSACLMGCALLSFNTPLVTDHTFALICMRFLMGMLQAPLFPAAYGCVTRWIPLEMRSFCYALMEASAYMSAISIFVSSGWIDYEWGWPAFYFIPGLLCMVTFLPCVMCLKDRPDNKAVEDQMSLDKVDLGPTRNQPLPPIKDVLTNIPVLACGAFKFAAIWNVVIIGSMIPTYLKIVLHQDLSSNGYTSAAIWGVLASSTMLSGFLSDQVISRGYLTRTRCRKAFSIIAGFLLAITLFLIPAAGCDPVNLHIVLLLNCVCNGFMGATDVPLPAEMSKNYPAFMYALLNTFAQSSGLVAPVFCGLVLDIMEDKWMAWCIVYRSSGMLLIVANIVFLMFASAERQPFDFTEEEKMMAIERDPKISRREVC